MDPTVSHSSASIGKCYSNFFPAFIEEEKMKYFKMCPPCTNTILFFYHNLSSYTEWQQVLIFLFMTAAHWLAGVLIITTTNPGLLSVLSDHYLRHFTAISNISLHCICLVFPFIRTLEFAQVRCTACITSRVASPIAEVRQNRGTNNRNRRSIRAKYSVLKTGKLKQESNVFTGK